MQQRFVQSLGYVGLASPNMDAWKMFAQNMLGMEVSTTPSVALASIIGFGGGAVRISDERFASPPLHPSVGKHFRV